MSSPRIRPKDERDRSDGKVMHRKKEAGSNKPVAGLSKSSNMGSGFRIITLDINLGG